MAPSLRHQQPESLSPRQRFQNQVRSLSSEDVNRGHRRNKSISLQYNPYELQHVSSLRVQSNPCPTSRSPARNRPSALRQVQEEPDFVLEERQAWSGRSPNARSRISPLRQSEPFVIYSDGDSDGDCTGRHQLRPFSPLRTHTNINDRPRTSRGSITGYSSTAAAACTFESPPSRSKFLEGSMTDRSQAVASTWNNNLSDYDTSASEAEDEDTPKAVGNRQSGSFDISDFDPPSANSKNIKRTLFRRKSSSRCLDGESDPKERRGKPNIPKESEEKKSKKRLRKSLSSWSLHSLGEKMGLFNSSSSSINNASSEPASENGDSQTRLLDERKRKAEIAYAQQFGFKKQKDNTGIAAAVPETEAADDKFATIRQVYHGHDPDATIKARSVKSAQRPSMKPSDLSSIFDPVTVIDHDARKRPTRRELEKENQQLREMLRRSQSAQASHDSLRSQFSQQQYGNLKINGSIVPPPRLSSNRKSAENLRKTHIPRAMSVDSPNQLSHIPRPMQSKADTVGRHRLSLDLSSRPSLPELPRSVDVIVEDPEGEESNGVCNETALARMLSQSSEIRRRHSMHSGDPHKVPRPIGKENPRSTAFTAIPSIVVSAATSNHHEPRSDWSGWDDDVF